MFDQAVSYEERVPAQHPLNGMRIKDVDDLFPKSFTNSELFRAIGLLVQDDHDYAMISESISFDEVDGYYNPGVEIVPNEFILEAIIVDKFSRTEKRMAAVQRVLNKHLQGEDLEALAPIVGKPKKSGTFAYVTVQIPFSDGQTVSVVFHAPEGDKTKITPNDTIVAFRWLLNRRDITHVVAPEDGSEVSLETIAKRLTQLVVQNMGRFASTQKDAAAEQKRLEDTREALKDADERQMQLMDTVAQDIKDKETYEATLSNLQALLEKQKVYNEELEARLDALRKAEVRRVTPSVSGVDRNNGMASGSGAGQKAAEAGSSSSATESKVFFMRNPAGRSPFIRNHVYEYSVERGNKTISPGGYHVEKIDELESRLVFNRNRGFVSISEFREDLRRFAEHPTSGPFKMYGFESIAEAKSAAIDYEKAHGYVEALKDGTVIADGSLLRFYMKGRGGIVYEYRATNVINGVPQAQYHVERWWDEGYAQLLVGKEWRTFGEKWLLSGTPFNTAEEAKRATIAIEKANDAVETDKDGNELNGGMINDFAANGTREEEKYIGLPTDPESLVYEEGAVISKEYIPEANSIKPTQPKGIDIDGLFEMAKIAQPSFNDVIMQVAKSTNGEAHFRPGTGLKKPERVIDKINRDEGGDMSRLNEVVDVLGATILYEPGKAEVTKAIPRVYQELEKLGWIVRRTKDRFLKPSGGYKDVLMNITHEVETEADKTQAFVAELLITTKAMSDAKMGPGHDIYEAMQILQQMIDKRSEKDRRKYELTKEQKKVAREMMDILDNASNEFYNSIGQESNAVASTSVIVEPLQKASELSEFLTSSSLYGKLAELFGRIRNTLPPTASIQGMSSYSTNRLTTTGSGSEYSGSISTGKLGTVRPSGNVTDNENNIVNPPENEASSTVTNVDKTSEEVNKKIENGGNAIPSYAITADEIIAGKYDAEGAKKIAKMIDRIIDEAEKDGRMEEYDKKIRQASIHLTALLKKKLAER